MNLQIAIAFGGMMVALLFLFGALMLFGRVARRLHLEFRKLKDDVERIDLRYEQLQKKLKEIFESGEQRIKQMNQMVEDVRLLKEDTANLIKKAELPFFLYSDRWTTADTEFLVAIENSSMTGRPLNKWAIGSWLSGRTYVVWAPNAEIALRNVQVKFSPTAGFIVNQPITSPLGFGALWEIASTA